MINHSMHHQTGQEEKISANKYTKNKNAATYKVLLKIIYNKDINKIFKQRLSLLTKQVFSNRIMTSEYSL